MKAEILAFKGVILCAPAVVLLAACEGPRHDGGVN